MRRAVIDIGSNTVKLLVAEEGESGLETIAASARATRLAENLQATGELEPLAIERTVAVIDEFCRAARQQGATRLVAVGTSALREAVNADALREAVRAACGLEVEVLSGDQEAELIFHGVTSVARWRACPLLVIDVGGGSAEFIQGRGTEIERRSSRLLGAVRLTEQFGDARFPALCEHLRSELHPLLAAYDGTRSLIGTGGTLVTLAGLLKDEADQVRLTDPELRRLLMELHALTLAERRALPRMPADRADIIVAGGMVFLLAMEALGAHEITVSTRNLRYGVLFNGLTGKS